MFRAFLVDGDFNACMLVKNQTQYTLSHSVHAAPQRLVAFIWHQNAGWKAGK